MGPKRNKKSEKCSYYDRGYCRNGEYCDKEHPVKVCPESNCFDDKCQFRHPNPCKFSYRCKFNMKKICLFSHITPATDDDKKIEELKKRINQTDKENKALISSNKDLTKKIENKFEMFENNIELLRNTLEAKENEISSLKVKINNIETAFEQKLTKLEKQFILKDNKFKCEKCKFETNSEAGLKSHISKKHKKEKDNDNITFPKQCDLCDKIVNTSKDMKNHLRTHSYKHVQFKCDQFDFIGGEEIEMEIHTARTHGETYECGLCDYESPDLETLDIHLKTCETYICEVCDEKISQLPNVKTLFEAKHDAKKHTGYPNGVRHVKPSRDNREVYDNKFHSYQSLFSDKQN